MRAGLKRATHPQRSRAVVVLGLVLALIAGCAANATRQQQGTVIGAVAGGAAGAAIDGKKGALIGAVLGGIAGNLIGRHLDRQEAALRAELGRQIHDGSVSLTRSSDYDAMVLSIRGNVLFDSGSAVVKPAGYDELNRIARAWHNNPEVNVVITGHTDNVGGLAMNRDLSAQRAEAVALYLLQRGVPFRSIYTRGAGELAPVADNNSPAGRARNRRVDLVFYPANVPPPEVRLTQTRDTEPVDPRRTRSPVRAAADERPERSYAFSEEARRESRAQQEQVRRSEATEPLSPIRSGSELLRRI